MIGVRRVSSVFGVLGFALCALYAFAEADENEGYRGIAVSTVKAERRCFEDQLPVSGVLVPKAEIKVWADRAGLQISEVFVEAGDSVSAGQVLARLVDPFGPPNQSVAIKSPVSGVAVGVSAIVGSYAAPTTATLPTPDPLFRIVVNGELEMRGEVLASALPRLRVGQTATLQIMGFGLVDGRVASIENSIQPINQLGVVRLSFAPDPRLRPGAFARAQIDSGQKCAVTVPLSAVLYGGEGDVVQVVRGDHVETRRVEVGLLQNGLIQIQDGVDPGDIVIERAGSFLREGDRVRPIQTEAPRTP